MPPKLYNRHLDLWLTPPLTSEEFSALGTPEQLRHLVLLGHLAPNSHNTQPWRFMIDTAHAKITLLLNTKSILPESDVVGRQAVISLGCALENMLTGAEYLGFPLTVHLFPMTKDTIAPGHASANSLLPIAELHMIPSSPETSLKERYLAIFRRKVMRAEFDLSRPIPPEVINELQNAITDEVVKMRLITDSVRRLSLSEFQGQADAYVMNTVSFARELGHWLLPNHSGSPIGMPGDTFGLTDGEAERIHNGLLGNTPLEAEDTLRFALAGKTGIEKSPLIALFTIPSDDVHDWIAAGRALERAFLIAETHNISVALHAAIVEVRLVNRMFAATTGTFRPLGAVIRMGYPKDKSIKADRPHSPRLPLEEVIITRPD